MRWIFRFLSNLVQAKRALPLSTMSSAGISGWLSWLEFCSMAYVAEAKSVLSLEFSQNQLEFIP